MFKHNSSSHEISTDTNAFVQNSKRDVVVLEGSSLSGVEERKGPENAGYCDIKFINSNKTMAAPINHPKTTAANDFSTVLLRHSSKLSSAVMCLDGLISAPPPDASIVEQLLRSRCATGNNSNSNNIIYYYNNATNLSNAIIIIIKIKIHNSNNKDFNFYHHHHHHHHHHHRRHHRRSSQQHHRQKTTIVQATTTAVNNNNDNDNEIINHNNNNSYNNTKSKSKKLLSDNNKDSFIRLTVAVEDEEEKMTTMAEEEICKKLLLLSLLLDDQIKRNYFDGSDKVIIIITQPKSDTSPRIGAYLKLKANHNYRVKTYSTTTTTATATTTTTTTMKYDEEGGSVNFKFIKPKKNNSKSVILVTLGSAGGLLLDNYYDYDYDYYYYYYYYQIDDDEDDFHAATTCTGSAPSITLIRLSRAAGPVGPRVTTTITSAVTEPALHSAPCVPIDDEDDAEEEEENEEEGLGELNYSYSHYYYDPSLAIKPGPGDVGALSLQDNNNKSNEPLGLFISFKPDDNNSTTTDDDLDLRTGDDLARDSQDETIDDIPKTLSCQEESLTLTNKVPEKRELLREYVATRDGGVLERLKNLIKSTASKYGEEDFYEGYKRRWGIAGAFWGLAGGGESSLNNSGTANWATAQPTTPNNNNNNNAGNSGWGSTPGNSVGGPNSGGGGPPGGNWQQVSGGRAVNVPGPNQNPGQVGPQGGQNPGPNAQAGPPTSQPNNPSQQPPNQANTQWPQQKPNANNPSASGPSMPVGPNNNSNNPMQPPQQQPQQQQQQPQQQSTQQQPGNPGVNNNQMNNAGPGPMPGNANNPVTPNNSSTKQQLEQLNTMREALFSPDGWGGQNINQDTNWDVPGSPEPNMCKDGMWKPPVNNGTDLWEANLRNGGQPPPPQQAKTPWGHTPSTNIGGTWGEDDDSADTSNMWTGAPGANQPNAAQWPGPTAGGGSGAGATGGGGPPGGNQTGMWSGGSNWGDPRVDPRDPRELRSMDPREMRDPRDHRMSLDPNDHMRVIQPMGRGGSGVAGVGGGDPRAMPQGGGGAGAGIGGGGEMRGDPRGISGRLNGAGAAEAMWNQPPQVGPPHHPMSQGAPGHQQQPQHPGAGASGPGAPVGGVGGPVGGKMSSMNQWTGPPGPKDMMGGVGGKPSGWEEPSPPSQRRNMPNYDDGTSLWGNPGAGGGGGLNKPRGQGGNMAPSNVSHWKDASANLGPRGGSGAGGMQCPPGMLQNQMNPGQGGVKPDTGPMWGHPSGPATHNGSWNDGPGPDAGGGWNDSMNKSRNRRYPTDMMNPSAGKGLWDEHNKPPQLGGHGGNWGDADMDPTSSWGHAPKPALTKEIIWNSREFRYLCDLGFKKEDVEAALRSREMNRDEAQELLSQIRPVDQWRRHDSHSGYDPSNQSGSGQSFPRFNHVSQQMPFPPQQGSRTPQNPPSTQQLRMLVQQIQLAVQEGYLNHQILNQALAPQTLLLLNQLLQQIKVLQQLHQQHTVQNSLKGNSPAVLQISVQITKTKQQIANLQNQIAVQQATYMKQQQQQQQQQQQHQNVPNQSSDYYKSNVHDPISALQNSFGELTMNKESPANQQQSRLNQWKLPSLDKDEGVNDFSRAPGSSSIKPASTPGGLQSHSSQNMNPLLVPGEGAWSSRLGESGWPDAGNSDSTDGKDWQSGGGVGGSAFTDLVPEFEPGKPWKMKTIEDDPSITPGSVVRSPLSLATIKDSDTIFSAGNKTSPPPQPMNESPSIPSLSNSTWSFNPPATTPGAFASGKNTWGESAPPPTAVTSELWGAPMSKSGRGPPPGLGNKGAGSVGSNPSNGWSSLGRSNTWGLQGNAPNPGNAGWVSSSTWLLLRNLTPQIDGSTLKTLCMQHGPVQDFRLYLNHGIALAKYSTRDEAIKAQGALNNCVLGNTTIFAESPADNDVHTLLQQLSHGATGGPNPQQSPAGNSVTVGGASGGWGAPRPKANPMGPPGGTDSWVANSSQLFSANSLWSGSGLDAADQQRATPSSLNSYLPGDLLGGESM